MKHTHAGIRWTRWRRRAQMISALFYMALPLANLRGFHAISGNLAALKVGRVDLVEPAAGLSAIVAGRHLAPALLLGMIPVAALALFLGPVFCSWACPWGLLSEWIDQCKPRRPWSGKPWLRLRRIRPPALAAWFVVAAMFAMPMAAFFSTPRLITSLPFEAIYLRMLSPVTGALLAGLLALEIFGPRRLWCRVLCPAGALANFLRCKFTLRVGASGRACACLPDAQCLAECRWGVDPRSMKMRDGCTNCLRCVEICPSRSLMTGFARPAPGAQ